MAAMGRVVVFAAVLLAACSAVAASNAPYVVQRGHIDLNIGPDGNTVILDAPQGLVVFDTGRSVAHAQAILDYARSTGKPVAAIVNSHWHLDHTTGNRDIRAAYPRAEIVASDAIRGALAGTLADSKENAKKALANPDLDPAQRQRIARSLWILTDPADLVPAHPVVKSGKRTIAGREFDVRLAPAAATAGDVWLLAADENLAVVGDLVVAQVPFFDTGCERGWANALDEIAKAKWDTLIPGHGAPMTRADFTRWRHAFDDYVECAQGAAGAEECAAGWERDAAGFYSKAEAASVHDMAVYYVTDVLRAPPGERMDYCRA